MPTYYARKAGNINATDVWATTPTGTAAAVTFVSGDVLMANSFAITVNVDTNLGSTGQVRNDNANTATAGGSFTLSNGVTLTANAFAGTATTHCVIFGGATGTAATLVGNANGGISYNGANNNSTGTLNIVGNVTGGSTAGVFGANNASTGTLNITGNCIGGSGGLGAGANNNSSGTITITGNCTGGSANGANGVTNVLTGTVTITGNCTGGSVNGANGAANGATGTLTITGNCTGGSVNSGAVGAVNSSTGTLTIIGAAAGGSQSVGASNSSTGLLSATRARGNAFGPGNSGGLTSQVGINNAGLGIVQIDELEYGTFGQTPTSGTGIRLRKLGSNVAVFNYVDSGAAKTLIDATQANQPDEIHVRSGVTYASGARVGACAVPSPSSVSFGVPVDATTGTAILDASAVASAVWSAATRTITGGTVTNLTNAPASVTPSDIWSHASRTLTSASGPTVVQIRQEMDSNSTQLTAIKAKTDNLPAAPAAVSNIPTADQNAAAVWNKPTTELTITGSIGERAKNQSTVSTTGAQLAAALS